jgi:glycerol uptake facilitator-like aquaporin
MSADTERRDGESGSGSDPAPETAAVDRGSDPGFDPDRLYGVVFNAVRDALLDVVGTLLLVGIALVLAGTGLQVVLRARTVAGTALGVAVGVAGGYLGATTLELVPPARDWL